jgi:glycosyltransferase 2 family protein
MKTNKSFLLNFAIIISVIGLMIFIVADDFSSITRLLSSIRLSYVILIVLLTILYHVLVGVSLTRLARVSNPKYTYLKGIHNAFIAAFFHGITPGSSGGQVAQAIIFNKQGVNSGAAASILWIEFIIHQAALVIVGFIFLFTKVGILRMLNSTMQVLVFLGFIVNMIVLLFLFLIVQSPRFNEWFLIKGLHLLKKVRLIKSIEKNQQKIVEFVHQFEQAQTMLMNNLDEVARVTIMSICKITLFYFIPYLVLRSFGVQLISVNFLDIMALSAFLGMLKVFAPLPGGAGGTEVLFIILFSIFTNQIVATSTMIVWRFVSFYMIMLIGFLFYMTYKLKMR